MLVLSQEIIRRDLTYDRASQLIRQGFEELARKQIESPARHVFKPHGTAPVIGFMPALGDQYLSAKVAAVNYANPQRGLDSHQGALLLFSRATGSLHAVLDATELTAIRTAAVSHLAMTYHLKLRDDASSRSISMAIVGAGVQAFHHIKMASSCFGITKFVVVSKSSDRVHELRCAAAENGLSIEHRPYGTALKDCQIILTATHGDTVVLERSQVASGSLILALGACQPRAMEVGQDILQNCHFVIDDMSSLLGCGEGLLRLESHSDQPACSFVSSSFQKSGDHLTVFKAVGLGFEDLVCAVDLYERSARTGDGICIPSFGGQRGY